MTPWTHGFLGCFNDITLCIVTMFVPCYVQGKVAEAVGEDCLINGLLMLVPILNYLCLVSFRGKVREKKGIEGSLLGDALYGCCGCCSLIQEAQEVDVKFMSRE